MIANKGSKGKKKRVWKDEPKWRPYNASYAPPPWEYDRNRGSDTVYKYSVTFKRPSRIEVIVKNYNGDPVVLLANGRKAFMLEADEFSDVISSVDMVKGHLIKCNQALVQGKRLNNLKKFVELDPSPGRLFAEQHLQGIHGAGRVLVREEDLECDEEEDEEAVEDSDDRKSRGRKRLRIESNSDTEEEEDLVPSKKLKLP